MQSERQRKAFFVVSRQGFFFFKIVVRITYIYRQYSVYFCFRWILHPFIHPQLLRIPQYVRYSSG